MAANVTTAFVSDAPRRGSYVSEIWKATGSSTAIGDTGALTPHMKKPLGVIGAFSWTISGQVITLTSLGTLGSGIASVEVYGLP